MTESIEIMKDSEIRGAQTISRTFHVPNHDSTVSISASVKSDGDGYLRVARINLDDSQVFNKNVSSSFSWSKTLDLSAGEHTLQIYVSTWVGRWLANAKLEYEPSIISEPSGRCWFSIALLILFLFGIMSLFAL